MKIGKETLGLYANGNNPEPAGIRWGWWERLARRGSSLRKWPRESRRVAGYRFSLAVKLADFFVVFASTFRRKQVVLGNETSMSGRASVPRMQFMQ